MNATLEHGTSASSSSSVTFTSTADLELLDRSRAIAGELAIAPASGRRDDAGLDGRRHTELELDEAAA